MVDWEVHDPTIGGLPNLYPSIAAELSEPI